MRFLTNATIAAMRENQEDSFADTCVIVSITETQDAYGAPVVTESDSAAKSCAFFQPASFSAQDRESVASAGTVQEIQAIVHLPVAEYENVSTVSRIKITHIDREALATPLTFDVAGAPQLLTSYVHVNLRDVSR